MKTIVSKLAIFLGALMMTGSAMAQWDSQTFGVTASVARGCLIAVKTHMAFGPLDVISDTGAQTQATFKVTCTNGSGDISLTFASANGASPGPASTFKMINGDGATVAKRLVYELYMADTETMIAYNTVTPFAELVADGTAKDLTIIGRIAAAAKKGAMAGAYKDTVTMTATYPAT